ncbi:uncharacterized protein LOC125450062 [Stegostoma tigrinum]|uniref:uncharacterized protein LOC125450062 n=1 Tax=Stegostoma tigrinum TaxID=3053191 RepID=UPI00287037AC|nr:uncharacterized protein LOC125450062 [Stegostoma tigrinum]
MPVNKLALLRMVLKRAGTEMQDFGNASTLSMRSTERLIRYLVPALNLFLCFSKEEGQPAEKERKRPDDSQALEPLSSLLQAEGAFPQPGLRPNVGAIADVGSPGWSSPAPRNAHLLYDKGRRVLRQIQELTKPPGGRDSSSGLLARLLREDNPSKGGGGRLWHLLLADEPAGPHTTGFGVPTPPWETGSLSASLSQVPSQPLAEQEWEPRGGARVGILSKAMLAAGIPTVLDRGPAPLDRMAPPTTLCKVATLGRATVNPSTTAQGPTWKRRSPCPSRTPGAASTSFPSPSVLPFGLGCQASAFLTVADDDSGIASPCPDPRFLRRPLLDPLRVLYPMTAEGEERTAGTADAVLDTRDGSCSDLLSDVQDGGCSDLLLDAQDGSHFDTTVGAQGGGRSDLPLGTQDSEPIDMVMGTQDGSHTETMADRQNGGCSALSSDAQDGGLVHMMADPPGGGPVEMMAECQDGSSSDLLANSQDGGSCHAFCASSPHLSEDFGHEGFYTPEGSPSDVEGDVDPEAQMARLGEDEEEPGAPGVLLGLDVLNSIGAVSRRPARPVARSVTEVEDGSQASGSSQSARGREGWASGQAEEIADDVYTEIHQDMFSKAFLFHKFMTQGRFQRKPSDQSGKDQP